MAKKRAKDMTTAERSAQRRTTRAAATTNENTAKLARTARASMAQARKQLDAADRRVSGYIERNPKAAAAMAAGIGAAVGAAIAAAMKRRR